MVETKYKTPKNTSRYKGEFIVFDTEDKNPRVLYHTPVAEEAYRKAEELQEKEKKYLVVERVAEGKNISYWSFS